MQPCPNPQRRFILAHLEDAAGRLGFRLDAPPRDKGARERASAK